jgi:hypothetical protein
MRFYTPTECAEWCERLELPLDDRCKPTRAFVQPHRLRCAFPPSFTQLLWFSRVIESALQPRETCLLWVTDWGIFPSNENQHLYYRLRQSYGDSRLMRAAPGHLCLDYERAEVVTLIQLCILFGWDVHLIPTVGYARAFVCHDEWALLGFDGQSEFEETRKALDGAGIKILQNDTV